MNNRVLVCSAWIASMGAGCVQYAAQPTYARVTIAATVPPQQASGGVAYNAADVPDVPSVPGQRVDAATIRRTLTGAGSWAEDETYGMVWFPSVELVGGQFAPYGTHGHWVLTDAGWYWQSELRWGWLTFHYGRWVVIREQWAWVPGAMFAPAWVDWRVGGGYVGWAPLPPQGAVFTAPYMFCGYDTLYMQTGLWSRLVYGPAAASIYATTTAVPTSYGYGGAVYAWGPTPVPVRVSDPARSGPPAVVPIASAWGTETRGNPRSGTPADATTTGSAGRPVGASSNNSIAATNVNVPSPRVTATPNHTDAIAATNVNVPSPRVTPITTSNAIAAPSVNVPSAGPPRAGQVDTDAWSADRSHAFAASAAATAATTGTPNQPGAWVNAPPSETGRIARMRDVEPAVAQPDTTTVYVDTSVVGPGRYRTADTVTLGSQVTNAPVRRPTVSLGTTGGYSDGFDSGYEAPVVTAAPAATSVPSVSGGAYAPPPSMPAAYAPAPTYAPSGYAPSGYAPSGYVQPSYGAAVAPSAAGYAPSFATPSPSVPVSVPSPSFSGSSFGGAAPVVRAPSFAAPVNAGGSFAAPVHTVAPVHTAPIAPVMAAPPSIGPSVGPTFRR